MYDAVTVASLHCLFVDFNYTVPILTTVCHYEGMLKAGNCRWGGWCIGFSYKLFPFLWVGSNTWCHDGFREGGFSMFCFFVIYQLARAPAHGTVLLLIILLFFSRKEYAESFHSPSPFLGCFNVSQLPWTASDVERHGLFIFLFISYPH